ncbi:MAG: porin [Rhodocyclaceae bacterium]|nr:porin [Rhodocyclaceae bacterium]
MQLPINEMSRVDFNYANFNRKEDVTDLARVSDNDAKSWAIQYSYNLSKRTMAYAGYTRVSNDNPSSATGQFTALRGASAATGGDYGVAPTDIGGDSRGWGVGLRHNF